MSLHFQKFPATDASGSNSGQTADQQAEEIAEGNAEGKTDQNAHIDASRAPNPRPVVVLIHGLACDLSDWFAVTRILGKNGFNAIALDLRGHGQSGNSKPPYSMAQLAKDAAETLAEQDLDQLILVGHSMGTRVILELRDLLGDQVRQMVLVDGSCQASGNPELARRSFYTMLEAAGSHEQLVRGMFAQMFTGNSEPELVQRIVNRAVSMPPAIFSELLQELRAWDASEVIHSLHRLNASTRTSVAVVQSTSTEGQGRVMLGPNDPCPYIDLLKQTVRRASVHIVEQTGHFIQLERPEAVCAPIFARFSR